MFDKRWKDPKWYSYLAQYPLWAIRSYGYRRFDYVYTGAWIRVFDNSYKRYGEWLGQTLRIPVTVQITPCNSGVTCPRCGDDGGPAPMLIVRPLGICVHCFQKEHDRNLTLWNVWPGNAKRPNPWTILAEIIHNPRTTWMEYAHYQTE